MSILSWFKKANKGDTSAPIVFDKGEEEFQGLNMKDALDAHNSWTVRLQDLLNGTSEEQLNVADVAVDHQCALGQWIHNHGKSNFSHMEEYDELKRIHADFHLTAGQVLNNVQHGDENQADEGLKAIRHKSGQVQLALVRLYSSAKS